MLVGPSTLLTTAIKYAGMAFQTVNLAVVMTATLFLVMGAVQRERSSQGTLVLLTQPLISVPTVAQCEETDAK